MKVLRISFLSGFALELIASLAVALISVSIGLRLLSGELNLMVGLFVLLLAPETFLPLRQVGAQFHASAEGVAASAGILDIIEEASAQGRGPARTISASNLDFLPGELSVLTGPSGVGKSTIFRRLLGFDSSEIELDLQEVAWMPQTLKLFPGTVKVNIVGPNGAVDELRLKSAFELAALDDLDPDHEVGGGASVSGGQAQRICLARAFYRALQLDCLYLLLDEPISALDDVRADTVVQSLKVFAARGLTVVAISHQTRLIDSADRVIEVAGVS